MHGRSPSSKHSPRRSPRKGKKPAQVLQKDTGVAVFVPPPPVGGAFTKLNRALDANQDETLSPSPGRRPPRLKPSTSAIDEDVGSPFGLGKSVTKARKIKKDPVNNDRGDSLTSFKRPSEDQGGFNFINVQSPTAGPSVATGLIRNFSRATEPPRPRPTFSSLTTGFVGFTEWSKDRGYHNYNPKTAKLILEYNAKKAIVTPADNRKRIFELDSEDEELSDVVDKKRRRNHENKSATQPPSHLDVAPGMDNVPIEASDINPHAELATGDKNHGGSRNDQRSLRKPVLSPSDENTLDSSSDESSSLESSSEEDTANRNTNSSTRDPPNHTDNAAANRAAQQATDKPKKAVNTQKQRQKAFPLKDRLTREEVALLWAHTYGEKNSQGMRNEIAPYAFSKRGTPYAEYAGVRDLVDLNKANASKAQRKMRWIFERYHKGDHRALRKYMAKGCDGIVRIQKASETMDPSTVSGPCSAHVEAETEECKGPVGHDASPAPEAMQSCDNNKPETGCEETLQNPRTKVEHTDCHATEDEPTARNRQKVEKRKVVKREAIPNDEDCDHVQNDKAQDVDFARNDELRDSKIDKMAESVQQLTMTVTTLLQHQLAVRDTAVPAPMLPPSAASSSCICVNLSKYFKREPYALDFKHYGGHAKKYWDDMLQVVKCSGHSDRFRKACQEHLSYKLYDVHNRMPALENADVTRL